MTNQDGMYYSMAKPHTWPEGGTYVMFSYFSFRNGKLNTGQSESVKLENVPATIKALRSMGRLPAHYRYENGQPVLVKE